KVQVDDRRLRAWRGTEVELRVQTNGGVKKAEVQLPGKDGAPAWVEAKVDEQDPEAFGCRFVLDQLGAYRVRFTPVRGETCDDPIDYELIPECDMPPHKVELTKPAANTKLPADGLLKVEGVAEDDIGVKGLTLAMQVVGGPKLKGKAYRSDK